MKVLLFDTTQSYLTPGGKQVHAQKLYENLPKVGVEVDYAKWWDPDQTFDIIHFFGYNAPYLINNIQKKGKKLVLTQIMDAQTNFSPLKKIIYSVGSNLLNILPSRIRSKFHMTYLNLYDALIYMHKFDKDTAVKIFHIDQRKAYIIPHACDPLYRQNGDYVENLPIKYLVSVGSIIERKRPLLLAQMAKEAKVPVVFIGAGNTNDEYYRRFISLVDNKFVYYLGFISQENKIGVLDRSSGFALLSIAESGCIAVYEAGALGLPLLLPELLWAKSYLEPKGISFCNCKNFQLSVKQLQDFYAKAEKNKHQSFKIHTWKEIASMYKHVYEAVLKN